MSATDDTDFYFDALATAPADVIELAKTLRAASRLRGTVTSDDPFGEQEIVGPVPVGPDRDGYSLNWFALARNPRVPGMPGWKWKEIVTKVRESWDAHNVMVQKTELSRLLDPDDDPFDDEVFSPPAATRRGEACARELLRLTTEFIATFLDTPPDITPEQAGALSPRQWEVVALVCNRRLEVPDAAKLLGIEPGTFRKHLDEAAKVLGTTVREMRRRRLTVRPGSEF